MAFSGNWYNPPSTCSTEMGGPGAESFTPAYWSHFLLLMNLFVPLREHNLATKTLQSLDKHVTSIGENFCHLNLVWLLNSCFPCPIPKFTIFKFRVHRTLLGLRFLKEDHQRRIATCLQKSWIISKAMASLLLLEILG